MVDGLALADRIGWAEGQFSSAMLGDRRRTRRLVRLAAQMAADSGGTIPQQTGTMAAMKAAYRLFAEEDVTHEAICRPHFEQTQEKAAQLPIVFLLQDTTTLDFTSHVHCEGLGPIGRDKRMRGLHQQNVLAVNVNSRLPLGLMYQRHHRRRSRPKGHGDNRAASRRVPIEERESYWWIEAIKTIGSPPEGSKWVHVGDRGEDIFGVYDESLRLGADWLIRISQDRRVETPEGQGSLFSYARSLPSVANRNLQVRRKGNGALEDVHLRVSAGCVTLMPSRYEPAYRNCAPIPCWVVRVWEDQLPTDAEPLEWLLCTSLSCETSEEAVFVAKGYSYRWAIEEFHKCEKSGCQVEMRRLEHVDRLEPLIGLLSVLAVWLMQLKFVARDKPDEEATTLFDEFDVCVMARYLRKSPQQLTVGEFWRGIGQLGGHPGRKGDGPLGWLRAWRGWQRFQLMILGASLTTEDERCG
ncbi:MAG: IS4 family transposase [Phycisphaerales bacterium]|nr:IS4 family transposase [Phycisphaerales bacterium]MCB9853148.1 IS4 family transposase [Phycisphaerales bacterium]MCB9855704.1 IS4 family transposase [Phycisphaerales bacterium]MCB9856771.1 IS4 family transposase [Phycisphaerales bacterium]MCB9862102.1 IS4 family transposase [Phycisphaerales bacterium]